MSNGVDQGDKEGEREMETREDRNENDKRQMPPEPPVNPGLLAPPKASESEGLEQDLAPSLTYVVAEGEPEIRLPDSLKNRYLDDKFFAPIFENPSQYKHYGRSRVNLEVDRVGCRFKKDYRPSTSAMRFK
jgi:hypothetical protein